ncbi:30S ribosomal protein S5 [Magnetococcus sp. PR-3]|uniref:30S ribosomal protein S5 n=1 Tax=Magnetococcus sp. PR-3 TaxID=3120355 RepID=UPI002FCDFA96
MSQRDRKGQDNNYENESEFIEKLVAIKRTAKVVKGGSRFNFSAIVVVGDGKGSVGYGLGKAKEVPEAIRKATEQAQKQMIKVEIKDSRTLYHEIVGRFGAGRVVLRPASAGTGIIAGGSMRPIFEAVGISDVLAKSTGTSNPHNLIKATFAALQSINPPNRVAAKRGMSTKNVRICD